MQPNQSNSLLSQAHQQVKARLQNGAIAIDATLGNGHDTLFLARHVAPNGMVYGFDIQEAAIVATRAKLRYAQLLEQVRLVLNCHAHLAEHIPAQHHGQIAVIMFNLGYLPGTDKQVITHSELTLVALNVALDLLAPDGILTILAYPGHVGGDSETAAVEHWLSCLDQTHFLCTTHYSNQPSETAPRLLVIEKLH